MEKITKDDYLDYLDRIKDEVIAALRRDYPDVYYKILQGVYNNDA